MELDKRFTACRLCLCSSEILIGIFDYHHGYVPAEIIVELLRFEVAKGDMFPQCVCGECAEKLIGFKKFKEICCIFKASLDRAYGAKFTKVPGKNLFLVGQCPVPCKIEKVRAVEEVGVRGPGIITHELGALNTDEEVIVPEDLSRIPFFPAKAEIDSEFEGNHQKNILVPIDLDQALCEDKSEAGAFICPDISGVENIDQVKTESEADEKDPEAVDEGKEGKIQETPSRSTCVAEKSGCQPSDGTEEKRSTRLRDQQLVQTDKGKENDSIEETPSRSARVAAEKSGCVAVNLSCHPSDGCEEPQGRLPRDAETEQVDGGIENDNIQETPSRSARVAAEKLASDGTEESRRALPKVPQIVHADGGIENDNIQETPSRSARVAAEKSGCHPSDGTEESRRALPRVVDGVKGNVEVQSLSKIPSLAEKSRSKNGESAMVSGKRNQRIIVVVGKRANTDIHRPSTIVLRTKESRPKNAEHTEDAGKMVQKVVGAIGKKGNTVLSLPKKLFYQSKNGQSLLKSLLPAGKSILGKSKEMVEPERKEQRVVEAKGMTQHADVQDTPKSPLVVEKGRSENSGDKEGTQKMGQKVVEAEGMAGKTDVQNIPKSPLVTEKDRSENSGDKEDTQKMGRKVVEAKGMTQHADVQDTPKSPLVVEKGRSENSGDKEGTQKMGQKVVEAEGMAGKTDVQNIPKSPLVTEKDRSENSGDKEDTQKMGRKVVEAEVMAGKTDVQNIPKSPHVAEKDRSENSEDMQGAIKMDQKDVDYAQGKSGKIVDRSVLVSGSALEAEGSNCERSAEEPSARVTRSMVAPPKQKKPEEQPSSADSDDKVDDPTDDFDLEDSESDFQPGDGSDSSDEEFVPQPPKRSKGTAEGPANMKANVPLSSSSSHSKNYDDAGLRAKKKSNESLGQGSLDCDCDACTGKLRKCHTPKRTYSFVNMDHDYASKGAIASGKSQAMVGTVKRVGTAEGPANMKADVALSSSSSHSKNYDDGGQRAEKKSSESLGQESLDCDCDACTGKLRKCHTPKRTYSFVNTDHDYESKGATASGKSQAMVGTVKRVGTAEGPANMKADVALSSSSSHSKNYDDGGQRAEKKSSSGSNSKDVSGNEDEDTTDFSSDLDSEDTDEEGGEGNDTMPAAFRGEKGVYDCSLCGKRYFQQRSFRYHMDQHKFGNRFKCNECGKAFHRKVCLISHMDVHQTERNFQCDVCGKAYKSSALLYCHKKSHGEKNYACELCGKKFITASKLNRHLECHNRDKMYPCEKCGKTFTTKDYVTKHVQTVHLNQWKKNHCCEVCGKIFPSPAALKSHRMIHTGEQPFKCSTCGKAFREKTMLKSHMNSHTKEKSYKCNVCDAVLSTMTSLARHMARHRGEMKYKCDNCGKQYTQSHNLKNHMKKCHSDSG